MNKRNLPFKQRNKHIKTSETLNKSKSREHIINEILLGSSKNRQKMVKTKKPKRPTSNTVTALGENIMDTTGKKRLNRSINDSGIMPKSNSKFIMERFPTINKTKNIYIFIGLETMSNKKNIYGMVNMKLWIKG